MIRPSKARFQIGGFQRRINPKTWKEELLIYPKQPDWELVAERLEDECREYEANDNQSNKKGEEE